MTLASSNFSKTHSVLSLPSDYNYILSVYEPVSVSRASGLQKRLSSAFGVVLEKRACGIDRLPGVDRQP
jgi:hypothetical protein